MKQTLLALFLLFLTACSVVDSGEQRLESALEFAGKNRGELEKVLEHYKDDSQKLEAAKFLIRNMPHWYSYEGAPLDSLKNILATAYKNPKVGDMSEIGGSQWRYYPFESLPKVYDAQVIKADYLIDNIDKAFDDWKSYPWNKHLSFEDFCELLLPYRIANEPLTNWRSLYKAYYGSLLDSLYRGSDVVEACRIINEHISQQRIEYYSHFSAPHLEATFLFSTKFGTCRESCDIGLYAMRSCGIPVAIDAFMYANHTSHQWLALRDTTGRYIQFGFDDLVPTRKLPHSDGRKKGKVYRSCFGLQEDQVRKFGDVSEIPLEMRNFFRHDVTDNYFGKNHVEIPLNMQEERVYLGIFSPQGWTPIDVGVCEGKKVRFDNIEPNFIYQPIRYDAANGKCIPVGYPFVFYSGNRKCRILKPISGSYVDMVLSRKMPLGKLFAERLWHPIIGSSIEASVDESFVQAKKLYEFRDTLDYSNLKIRVSDRRCFRYLRYNAPKKAPMELADLDIYEDSLCRKPIVLKLLTPVDSSYKPENVTDHDMLTTFYSGQHKSLTYELDTPSSIRCVDFYPRTDGNFVWAGDTYELLYYAGDKGWVSLGKTVATGKTVAFRGPKNALFWLRDLTQGKEEQVFFYENGKQVFSYDIK